MQIFAHGRVRRAYIGVAGTTVTGVAVSGGSGTRTTVSAGVSANWTLDIWGQIRRTVESDRASAQASAAALAAATLSAQGELDDIVVAEQQSLKITESRYRFGVAAKADVVTAQAQLLNSQAQQINAKIQRGILEHAIAVLLGQQPASFSLAASALRGDVPTVRAWAAPIAAQGCGVFGEAKPNSTSR